MASNRIPQKKSRSDEYLESGREKSAFTFTLFGLREGTKPEELNINKLGCAHLNNRMELERHRLERQQQLEQQQLVDQQLKQQKSKQQKFSLYSRMITEWILEDNAIKTLVTMKNNSQ